MGDVTPEVARIDAEGELLVELVRVAGVIVAAADSKVERGDELFELCANFLKAWYSRKTPILHEMPHIK
jgi:hypothetical protein